MQDSPYRLANIPRLCLVLATILTILSIAMPAASQDLENTLDDRLIGVSFVPERAAQERLDEMFFEWSALELDLPEMERRARDLGSVDIQLDGQLFELELIPVELRSDGYREAWNGTGPRADLPRRSTLGTYKGTVKGQRESSVRLLILPDLLQGYIRTDDNWFFIDPLAPISRRARPTEVVFYEQDDLRSHEGLLCGTEAPGHNALDSILRSMEEEIEGTEASGLEAPQLQTRAGLAYSADIATEADYEYYQVYGANTNSQIAGIINQVNGIFENEVNLSIELSYQSVWASSSDPYTSSTTSGVLDQFRSYWNANQGSVPRDVAHLFSGRTYSDAAGRAWLDVVCNNPGYSYGLTANYPAWATKIVAHELGHNFDASHDDAFSPPAATCNGSGPLMCSIIQSSGANVFSSQSKTDINLHIGGNDSCLDPVGWCEAETYCPGSGWMISCIGSDSCFSMGCAIWCDGSLQFCPGYNNMFCY